MAPTLPSPRLRGEGALARAHLNFNSRGKLMWLATGICCSSLLFLAMAGLTPACANDITQEWASVKPPPVPELKPATIDPKTTALLVLDFMKSNCGTRPRCV